MRKFLWLGCLLTLWCGTAVATHAQTVTGEYHLGKVLEVLDAGTKHDDYLNQDLPYQSLKVELDNGTVTVVEYGGNSAIQAEQLVSIGDQVVLVAEQAGQNDRYAIVDRYRLPWLWVLLGIFAVVVIALTRWRGVGALIGVGVSLVALVEWLIPQLLQTHYPLLITFGTLVVLAVVTFYLGHGIGQATQIALVATIATLAIAVGLATGSAWLLHLSGTGSEAALSLKYGFGQNVNLSSLLLAGLLLGALGVLDDVTTAQAQAVYELKLSDSHLSVGQLFNKAFRIGKAHIVALVNTLVLAYAGAALPAFLLLTNFSVQPLWVSLNSEAIVEEIMQMFVGSFALVLAVPITTILAAWWVSRQRAVF